MGSFANTLFTILLGWLQGIVSAVWSAFTTENGQSLFSWIGKYWILIAGILCMIGLTADLCVYVFRWKPYRVWKSFFSRRKGPEEPSEHHFPEEDSFSVSNASRTDHAYRPAASGRSRTTERTGEPDLSRWGTETKRPEAPGPTAAEQPVTVTNAGYSVPMDSPYRRPAGKPSVSNTYEQTVLPDSDSATKKNDSADAVSLRPRRRRHISVNELFSDPEEELLEFDAPQDIIDRKKAYHEPVYPRGWKKNEDEGE